MDYSVAILVWILCGIGAFLIAQNRGATNAPTWFLVGVLLGPIGILLAAIGAKGNATAGSTIGAADELQKLAALRDNGTLTPVEFERQKAGLLATPSNESGSKTGRYIAYGFMVFLVLIALLMLTKI